MVGVGAAVSVVTMPLTAVWFLLVGGVLLISSLTAAALRDSRTIGGPGLVGLGLLVGPAIYLSLAALQ